MNRDGGYTRVVRTEPMNKFDQAESAILEFVDGARDSRFMLIAKTVARDRLAGREHTDMTLHNLKKVTQFRGEEEFEAMVKRYMVKSIEPLEEEQEEAVATKKGQEPETKA